MAILEAPVELTPPFAEKRPHRFTYHGITVTDPWHWLKDQSYPEVNDEPVLDYLKAENAYFEAVMAPHKTLTEELFQELKGRIKEDDASVPWVEHGFDYRWTFRKGSQYRIWDRKPGGNEDWNAILDENKEAEGLEYFKLGDLAVSPDTKLMAWSADTNGSERFTIHVKDLGSDEALEDAIPETSGDITWAADSKGFLYTVVSKEWRPYQVRYHRLGSDPKDDPVIYEEQDSSFFVGVDLSSSEEFIFIRTADHVTAEVYVIPADTPLEKPKLMSRRKAKHDYDADHGQGRFFIRSNDQHKNFRIATAPEDKPEREHWATLIAGSDRHYFRGLQVFRDFIAIQEGVEGLDQIRIRNADDSEHYIELPEAAYSAGIGNNPQYDQKHLRINYESMVTPDSVFDYSLAERKLELRKEQEIPSGYDKTQYVTERFFTTARDGAKVPVSVVYKKGFNKNGQGRLHLTGYGAYGHDYPPGFSSARLSLLDRGFAYAIAHIRGGDDMGYQWYEDGKLDKRTNTFNDFVDVARDLIAQHYTSTGNISISGGSAGGELMGAVINQVPELWRGAVLHVPFVDVLNTMLDTSLPLTPIEWPEWGNPIESKEAFELIQSYSPYDHIEAKTYPPMLVTGGINDPRVTYWEPAKWTAKLRHTKTDDNLLMMKINMGAGHGGKSGRYESLYETAEEYTFLLMVFDAVE